MPSFTKPLIVTQLPSGLWQLLENLVYETKSGENITVPKGFITDFFSIPFPATLFFPKSERGDASSILHDFLYSIQIKTRKQSDDIFLEAMIVLGVHWFKRGIIYNAVRLGGWIPWNAQTKKLKN